MEPIKRFLQRHDKQSLFSLYIQYDKRYGYPIHRSFGDEEIILERSFVYEMILNIFHKKPTDADINAIINFFKKEDDQLEKYIAKYYGI